MTKSDFAKRTMSFVCCLYYFPEYLPEFTNQQFSMESHFKCGISEASNYLMESKAIE